MHRGYVKLWRKMAESRTWSRGATTIGVAVALVLRANHRDGWFAGRIIRRGQLALGQEAFATEMGLSRSQLRRILENLTADAFLSTIPANKYTMITILKYDTYQSEYEDKRPADDTADEPADGTADDAPDGTTSGQPAATNKNEKNDKKCVSRAGARKKPPVRSVSREGEGKALNWTEPTEAEVSAYALSHGRYIDAVRFVAYWSSVGWERSGQRVKDWRPLALTWRDDRQPESQRWKGQYDAAKAGVERAVAANGGRLEAGMATQVIAAVREQMGSDYRPGDRYPYDGAYYGGKAAVEAWKAALERRGK